MLKTLIIFVVVLLIISLGASLVFLLLDQGKTDSKRTVYALGARVTFAVILILLLNPPLPLFLLYAFHIHQKPQTVSTALNANTHGLLAIAAPLAPNIKNNNPLI